MGVSGVEDHGSNLMEGIVEFTLQEAATLAVDLSCCCRIVDRDVVMGDPDKVAAVFVMLFHHGLGSPRATALLNEPEGGDLG